MDPRDVPTTSADGALPPATTPLPMPVPFLAIDQVFAGHRLVRLLGRGGMGVVWEGEHLTLRRRAAIKVRLGDDEDAVGRERFLREARAAAGVVHPNVVAVHDAGEDAGIIYLVMELVTGGSLQELLRGEGANLDPARAVRLVRDAAHGLAAIHAAGLLHRDLKPANILIDAQGNAKVADFGLARSDGGTRDLTGSSVVGTPRYLAPELLAGARSDTRTDIYALGVALHEMLTGRPAFAASTPYALYHAIATGALPPPSRLRPQLGRGFDELVARATALLPEHRFVDAAAFAAACAEAPRSLRAPRRQRRVIPLAAWMVAGGSLALLAIGHWSASPAPLPVRAATATSAEALPAQAAPADPPAPVIPDNAVVVASPPAPARTPEPSAPQSEPTARTPEPAVDVASSASSADAPTAAIAGQPFTATAASGPGMTHGSLAPAVPLAPPELQLQALVIPTPVGLTLSPPQLVLPEASPVGTVAHVGPPPSGPARGTAHVEGAAAAPPPAPRLRLRDPTDRFSPGWWRAMDGVWQGAFAHGDQVVVWGTLGVAVSNDQGDRWTDPVPLWDHGAVAVAEAVIAADGIWVRGIDGGLRRHGGRADNRGLGIGAATRIAVTGDGLLAIEDGGIRTALLRNGVPIAEAPGRLGAVFADAAYAIVGATAIRLDGTGAHPVRFESSGVDPSPALQCGRGAESAWSSDGREWRARGESLACIGTLSSPMHSWGTGESGPGLAAIGIIDDATRGAVTVGSAGGMRGLQPLEIAGAMPAGTTMVAAFGADRTTRNRRRLIAVGSSGIWLYRTW